MAEWEDREASAPSKEQVDAVMLAAQVLVAVTARSVAEVEDVVTLPQLRVLVMISAQGPLNLNSVAQGLGVHASNVTRACDRLVSAGLLDRRESLADRRHVSLDLTEYGRVLVQSLVTRRRAAIADVLERMPEARRRALVPALKSFAAAAGEEAAGSAWALAWPVS